jgi:hypothetical protein
MGPKEERETRGLKGRRTMKSLLLCLAAALLLLLGRVPPASADEYHPGLGNDNSSSTAAAAPQPPSSTPSSENPDRPQPTFAYFLAVVSALIVFCILCMPSRKAESATSRR